MLITGTCGGRGDSQGLAHKLRNRMTLRIETVDRRAGDVWGSKVEIKNFAVQCRNTYSERATKRIVGCRGSAVRSDKF